LYKIPANTLFLGKHIVFVPECHSTNTLALQLSQNPSTAEGTVVITNKQTAGRGQRGNVWESSPGMNLTFSVVLRPAFLTLQDQFYLTMAASLALHDYLSAKTEKPTVIKWPNDILVHEKKICGILIENQVQGSRFIAAIAGIGLNVNQSHFSAGTATSMALVTGREESLETVLHGLLEYLEARYLQLRRQDHQRLKEDYLSRLYALNEPRRFASQGSSFEGVIQGIDENGRLAVETRHQGLRYFGIKEIALLQ
jgi:BirA family transcriptional regulator, biotin operon repressor / biotin---[acetyl-CoA-carboxylase] ligase